MRFADTNVLLYAISTDPAEAHKSAIAKELLSAHDLALSVQVLQEFYVQATRASRADALTHDTATALVETFTRFSVQPITLEIMQAALHTKHRFQLSYWDSAIIEAARSARCDIVLSEDLGSGQDYDGVRVVNPFLD